MSMSSVGGGVRGAVAEINVTPLIDVLLVLLIIFMVIVPVTPRGLEALVPQPPRSLEASVLPETIVIEVLSGRDGVPTYRINDSALAKSAVETRLAEIFSTRQEKTMFVKGDPALEYSSVAEIVDFAHRAGVENIGIITPKVAAQ